MDWNKQTNKQNIEKVEGRALINSKYLLNPTLSPLSVGELLSALTREGTLFAFAAPPDFYSLTAPQVPLLS